MLILMAGLPGTGKSTVARELAERLEAVVLSKDVVRHALFPPALVEYSAAQDDFVVEVLLLAASYLWSVHPTRTIILDGRTFSRAAQRQQVISFAVGARQTWRIVECVCDDQTAKVRLDQPFSDHPARNRTPALYDQVKARWEPIAEAHLVVRTDQVIPYDATVKKLVF
jgi:adenylylsulfate kinase